MAIRVVHGPSAGLVGAAAFFGGAGQFGRFRMQLRQQERLQQQQISAARSRQERGIQAQFNLEADRRQDALERQAVIAQERERQEIRSSAQAQQAIAQQQASQEAELENRLQLQRLRSEGATEQDIFRFQLDRVRGIEKQRLQERARESEDKSRNQRRIQQGQDAVQWIEDQADWDPEEKAKAKRAVELKFFAGGVDIEDDPDMPDIEKAMVGRVGVFNPDMNGQWVLQANGNLDFKASRKVEPKEERDPLDVNPKEVNDLVRQAFATLVKTEVVDGEKVDRDPTPKEVEKFVRTRLELRNRLLGRPTKKGDEEEKGGRGTEAGLPEEELSIEQMREVTGLDPAEEPEAFEAEESFVGSPEGEVALRESRRQQQRQAVATQPFAPTRPGQPKRLPRDNASRLILANEPGMMGDRARDAILDDARTGRINISNTLAAFKGAPEEPEARELPEVEALIRQTLEGLEEGATAEQKRTRNRASNRLLQMLRRGVVDPEEVDRLTREIQGELV